MKAACKRLIGLGLASAKADRGLGELLELLGKFRKAAAELVDLRPKV